jgi:hypothetical protein
LAFQLPLAAGKIETRFLIFYTQVPDGFATTIGRRFPRGPVAATFSIRLQQRGDELAKKTVFMGRTFLPGNDDRTTERMRSARADENFFPLLGVERAIGRAFSAEEVRRRDRAAVIRNALWQRRFGGSFQALGADLTPPSRCFW